MLKKLFNFELILLCFIYYMDIVQSQTCTDSRSRPGNCVPLSKCPQLIAEFYDEAAIVGMDFDSFVSDSICGFDGTNFLICCTIRGVQALQNYDTATVSMAAQPTFTTTANPLIYNLPAGAIFHFAALGSSANTPPLPPMIYPPNISFQTSAPPPPMLYPQNPSYQPPMIYPSNSPSTYPTMAPVIFQPGYTNTNPTLSPSPAPPVTVSTTVVYKPVPVITTKSPIVTNPAAGAPSGCGISKGTTNRVVGGAEAKKGTYPWMAALGYLDEVDRTTLKFLCGGSLVSSRHVLSSAHCINSALTLVRLGAHDLSNPVEANAMDFRIRRSVVHENFDLKSIAHDIAVIELNGVVPNTNFISPICLPEGANFLTQDFVGMHPFVAGWGAMRHQGATSHVLRDVQVPVVSRATCQQSYRSIFQFVQFSDKLICAGNANVDACQGDSGGPLMLPQPDSSGNYRYFLLGIVSYGYECARSGFPGVYTRVASYMSWLQTHMQ